MGPMRHVGLVLLYVLQARPLQKLCSAQPMVFYDFLTGPGSLKFSPGCCSHLFSLFTTHVLTVLSLLQTAPVFHLGSKYTAFPWYKLGSQQFAYCVFCIFKSVAELVVTISPF